MEHTSPQLASVPLNIPKGGVWHVCSVTEATEVAEGTWLRAQAAASAEAAANGGTSCGIIVTESLSSVRQLCEDAGVSFSEHRA